MTVSQIQRLTIQVLTLRGQDIRDFLQEQVTENPLLDIQYKDVYAKGAPVAGDKPLHQIKDRDDAWETSLLKQLRLQPAPKRDILAAGLIIQQLDDKGFCTEPIDDLGQEYGLDEAAMARGLRLVQSLEPAGIGARTVAECLLLQVRRLPQQRPVVEAVLREYYDDFLHGRWQVIQRGLGISQGLLTQVRDVLKGLALQPLATVDTTQDYIRPDVEIYQDDAGRIQVRSLEELPQVLFRDDLYAQYTAQGDTATRQFVRKAKQQFLDLQSALAYRLQSILTVVTYVAQYQAGYFQDGTALRPLLQVDIAKATCLSTATVSRVCRERYVLWQGCVVPLQQFLARSYFQGNGESGVISDKAIMASLQQMIEAEDKRHPLSDQALTRHFQQQDITIARRTVTKFRLAMHIPSSTMRRRIHALQEQ